MPPDRRPPIQRPHEPVHVEKPPRVPWEHVGLRNARAIRGCVRLNVELYSAIAR
jgi:hypothetical protein